MPVTQEAIADHAVESLNFTPTLWSVRGGMDQVNLQNVQDALGLGRNEGRAVVDV